MNELALYAGAGGGLLASRWLLGHRIVCYIERDPYCVAVIKARISQGLLDDAPIWDDVRTFDGRPWRGLVDKITAGFQCQPWSQAGKLRGADDDRNGWPDTLRLVNAVEPEWVSLENVPTLITGKHRYFGQILSDLAQSGYDVRWRMLSAAEVGAPHKRNRAWIVAHANEGRRQRTPAPLRTRGQIAELRSTDVAHAERPRPQGSAGARLEQTIEFAEGRGGGGDANVAHADSQGPHQPPAEPNQAGRQCSAQGSWWLAEPDVGRVADGVAHRVDRIRALGNGQVPAVAAAAWRLLSQSK